MSAALAFVGGLAAMVAFIVLAGIGVTTLWCRIRSGSWWWDDAGDGVESGQ